MIIDDVNLSQIFCIFYSQYIDQICMSTLQNCCKSLLQFGEDLLQWHNSSFGEKIRFCDLNTYAKTRDIWSLYSQGALPHNEVKVREKYQKDYFKVKEISEKTIMTSVFQCSSPCTTAAAVNALKHNEFFHEYHRIGHLPIPIYPNQPPQPSSSTSPPSVTLNPMILRGRQQLHDLHYGSDPSLGYHLSLLYAEIEMTHPLYSKNNKNDQLTSQQIYQCCFKQFSAWCQSYRSQYLSQLITIRCFIGEAFLLSQILQNTKNNNQLSENNSNESNQYFPKYSDSMITLLNDAPLEYDVIDTSNIGDSFGLLQVLCYCIDLLKHSPHSVLHTESITTVKPDNKGSNDGATFSELNQELKSDLFTLCSLLGIILQDSYTYCTDNSTNNISVVANDLRKRISQYEGGRRSIYAWKLAGCSLHEISTPLNKIIPNKILLTQDHFISIFINIYKNCFRASFGSRDYSEAISLVTQSIAQNSFAQPITLAYVTLIQKAMKNIEFMEGSLNEAVNVLTKMVLETNLMCASNHIQDLLVWCTRLGLITTELLLITIDENRERHNITASSPGMVHFGSSPSLFIYLTLLVPKSAMEQLPDLQAITVELAILTPAFDNRFTSLHLSHIRRITQREVLPGGTLGEEDIEGDIHCKHFSMCLGSPIDYSYLAVTAIIPSYMITLFSPYKTRVALILSTETYVKIPAKKMMQYGLPPSAYVTTVSDTSHVSWRDAPTLEPSAFEHCDTESNFRNTLVTNPVVVDITPFYPSLSSDGKILQYVNKITIPRTASSSTAPTVVPGNHPCEAILVINSSSTSSDNNIHFTVPPLCDIANGKLKKVKESNSYTFTLLPLKISPALQYPLCRMAGGPYPWGLSRILLSSLPKLQLPTMTDYHRHWLYTLAGMQMSLEERKFRNTSHQSAVSCLKDSIHSMILRHVGFFEGGSRSHWSTVLVDRQVKAFIFINALRLELSLANVVLDCVMATVTDENESHLLGMSPVIMRKEEIISVIVTPEEYSLWKQIAPALNERCRCTWTHLPGCEYSITSREKLATVTTSSTASSSRHTKIICSCGLGQDLQNTEFVSKYSTLSSCFQYFHRIAITPMLCLLEAETYRANIQKPQAPSSSPSSTISSTTTSDKCCGNCGMITENMKVCSRCVSTRYCSQECQLTNWPSHKKVCKKISQAIRK